MGPLPALSLAMVLETRGYGFPLFSLKKKLLAPLPTAPPFHPPTSPLSPPIERHSFRIFPGSIHFFSMNRLPFFSSMACFSPPHSTEGRSFAHQLYDESLKGLFAVFGVSLLVFDLKEIRADPPRPPFLFTPSFLGRFPPQGISLFTPTLFLYPSFAFQFPPRFFL